MELPDSKTLKHEGNTTDRISELHDDILIKLLSFLPPEEAVRTSFLSHRWQHLWEFLPVSFTFHGSRDCIHVDDTETAIENLRTERCKFVRRVNNVLILHRGPIIDELSVRCDLDKDSQRYIDKWIEIALRKKVRKLKLDFFTYRHRDSNMHYPFPQECFSRVKTTSRISGTEFLASLSLKDLGVSDEIMESILSNCPMLESLHVIRSPQLRDPKVSGSSLRLKHLHVCWCDSILSIEVSAPNLVSFEYSGRRIPLHIRYAPKLNEICYFNPPDYRLAHAFSQLSNYLPQLVTLRLCMVIFETYLASQSFPELTSLRHLTCEVHVCPGNRLLILGSLIEASPFLHKFKLEIVNYNEINSQLGEVQRVEGHPNTYLKEVEIVGFKGQPTEAEFVTYLLKSAVKLEKIVIDTSPPNLAFLEKEKFKEVVETTRQMAKKLAHQLMENRPGAELVLL